MTQLSGDLIRHKLPTFTFGQHVIFVPRIGSTNTELKQYARQGAPEGLLYITDEQLVGRGRLKRSWVAPPGSSLLMSLLFRPQFLEPIQTQQLTMMCCLAMLDSIKEHTGLSALVKWPNDIIWTDQKKLAGMLTEAEFDQDRTSWVVVGIGLNVNVDFSRYLDTQADPSKKLDIAHSDLSLAQTATSLSTILERDTHDLRLPLVQGYLRNVEQRYEALRQGVSPHFEWQRKLADIGKTVTVTKTDRGDQYSGAITGVDENGALRLRQVDGSMITILAGDVTLR